MTGNRTEARKSKRPPDGSGREALSHARATRLAKATPAAIAEAAAALHAGGLVAFPTETVYGLGARADDERAVAALYAAKGRPSFNPLIAHTPGLESAEREGVFCAEARAAAKAFWPGPLTLIVPAGPTCTVSLLARAGLETVALRAPSHPVARALLEALGRPVVAPSANLSGRVSPTRAEHVAADLADRIDLILDDGPTPVGIESTILSCVDGKVAILRPGGLARETIEAALGRPLDDAPADPGAPRSPGLLASHYAPAAALRLEAETVAPHEAALDFGGRLAGGAARLDLSPTGDLAEAAANLFSYLRRLDESGVVAIAAAPIPREGLGEAINDRLRRAAAPRS